MKGKKAKILITVLCILNIVFIFSNSLMSAEVSSAGSSGIRVLINELLRKAGIPFVLTQFHVRKAAHFAEFMLFGVILALTVIIYKNRLKPYIVLPLFIGLLTAVADEFIQLFIEGRSGQVSDIVLDFAGLITGILIVGIIRYVRN